MGNLWLKSELTPPIFNQLYIYWLNMNRYDVSLPFYLDRDRALYQQMGLGRTPDLVSLRIVEHYATFQVMGRGRDAVGPG